jgi:hypothetical protein
VSLALRPARGMTIDLCDLLNNAKTGPTINNHQKKKFLYPSRDLYPALTGSPFLARTNSPHNSISYIFPSRAEIGSSFLGLLSSPFLHLLYFASTCQPRAPATRGNCVTGLFYIPNHLVRTKSDIFRHHRQSPPTRRAIRGGQPPYFSGNVVMSFAFFHVRRAFALALCYRFPPSSWSIRFYPPTLPDPVYTFFLSFYNRYLTVSVLAIASCLGR